MQSEKKEDVALIDFKEQILLWGVGEKQWYIVLAAKRWQKSSKLTIAPILQSVVRRSIYI